MERAAVTRDALIAELARIARERSLPAPTLFGSWARGTQREGSDVDVVIDLAGASHWHLFGFAEDVYERTGLTPDVYDVSEVRGSRLWPEICSEGVVVLNGGRTSPRAPLSHVDSPSTARCSGTGSFTFPCAAIRARGVG